MVLVPTFRLKIRPFDEKVSEKLISTSTIKPNSLTIGHLLYANDAKLIQEYATAPQSSLGANSKWSEDWELILNPAKCERLPVGDTANPVTCAL